MLRYLSVCAGIEAFSVAVRGLPFEPVAFSEIEPFPCAVLAHHYPDVPNLGDMTKIDGSKYRGAVDLIVGGTPCQDFSVAGKRAGMAGERSGLALDFVRLVSEVRPRWIVWENVPGAFSTNGGRDFGTFIKALDDIGYHCAWRVLDAQFFGVPQRRRRVFLVGYFGDWRPAAAVLFEPSSLRGNSAQRRKARTDVAGTIDASAYRSRGAGTNPGAITPALTGCLGRGGADDNRAQGNFYVSHWNGGPHPTLSQSGKGRGGIASSDQELFAQGGAGLVWSPEIISQDMSCKWPADIACTLNAAFASKLGLENQHVNGGCPLFVPGVIAFQPGNITRGAGSAPTDNVFPTLKADHGRGASDQQPHVMQSMQVRRLTPRECERLQGFPDDYTLVPYKRPFSGLPKSIIERSYRRYIFRMNRQGKKVLPLDTLIKCCDSPRYRALGNSMAVPVVRWITERIAVIAQRFTDLLQGVAV